jgi:hypothetical protein
MLTITATMILVLIISILSYRAGREDERTSWHTWTQGKYGHWWDTSRQDG